MKLIYIKSTMEPKNYATLRSLLKQEQGEKITPYIFKLENPQLVRNYLERERISYEVYQEERQQMSSPREKIITDQELERAYKEAAQDKNRWIIGKKLATAATNNFSIREKKGNKMAQRIIRWGDICWADFGSRDGHEIQDIHPVIIASNDKQNLYSPLVIVVPITSKIDKIYPFEVPIQLEVQSKILTDQIAVIDKKRVGKRID